MENKPIHIPVLSLRLIVLDIVILRQIHTQPPVQIRLQQDIQIPHLMELHLVILTHMDSMQVEDI